MFTIDCGGTLTGPSGELEWSNITNVYKRIHINCEWRISVRPGRTIMVEISNISIENPDPKFCNLNYLVVSIILTPKS